MEFSWLCPSKHPFIPLQSVHISCQEKHSHAVSVCDVRPQESSVCQFQRSCPLLPSQSRSSLFLETLKRGSHLSSLLNAMVIISLMCVMQIL